jgi:hypothetical protein
LVITHQGQFASPIEVVGGVFATYSARYAVLGMVTATEVYLGCLALLAALVRELHQADGTKKSLGQG